MWAQVGHLEIASTYVQFDESGNPFGGLGGKRIVFTLKEATALTKKAAEKTYEPLIVQLCAGLPRAHMREKPDIRPR